MHNFNNFNNNLNNGLPGFPNNSGYDLTGRYQVGYRVLMDLYRICEGRLGRLGI